MDQQDGATSYSTVAVVNLGANAATLQVYPNPAVSLVTISGIQQENATVTLVSELGQVMIVARVENSNQVQLNVSGLASGVYFVRIGGTDWTAIKTILVRH